MDFLAPVSEQERPSFAHIEQMWRQLVILHLPTEAPALDEYLDEARRTHDNGGAQFGSFALPAHPVLHWFASRNRLEEVNFFEHLVRSPAFAHALPMLQPPVGRIIAKWEWGSSLTLDGELARLLVQGGAYHAFAGTAAQAKALGGRVCDALFGERYTDVEIFRTWEAWCPWFKGIAWDGTWLGIDKRESRVWLLSVTDTD